MTSSRLALRPPKVMNMSVRGGVLAGRPVTCPTRGRGLCYGTSILNVPKITPKGRTSEPIRVVRLTSTVTEIAYWPTTSLGSGKEPSNFLSGSRSVSEPSRLFPALTVSSRGSCLTTTELMVSAGNKRLGTHHEFERALSHHHRGTVTRYQ